MKPSPSLKAVFLDRDGTINKEVSFLKKMQELRLLPGTAKAISLLNKAGFKVIVITNQSGVARGYINEAFLTKLHKEIEKRLARKGARIDGWYYCPHHPEFGSPDFRKSCTCRKPDTGLIYKAKEEMGLCLPDSFMVGDSLRDIQAGWNAGLRTVLVLTGYGKKTLEQIQKMRRKKLDYIAQNLLEAAEWIVKQY